MTLRHLFFGLFIVGTILPYSQFIPWFIANGLDLRSFVSELFSTSIGGFFGMDVIVSAIVLCVFATVETARLEMRRASILTSVFAATILVGGSSGLPLFLYFRQKHLDDLEGKRA